MTTTPNNRLNRLQEAHPWMNEEQARHIGLCSYYVRTRVNDLSGAELQEAMERDITKMCNDTRENLLTLLPEELL